MSLIEISEVALLNWKAVENESLDISLDSPLGMKDWHDLGPVTVFVDQVQIG